MTKRIAQAIVSLIALLTFVVIGARVVETFDAWECLCSHSVCEWCVDDWTAYHAEAVSEYADEFTALFNSYSYKLSKNGRSMVNGKFVKMGA